MWILLTYWRGAAAHRWSMRRRLQPPPRPLRAQFRGKERPIWHGISQARIPRLFIACRVRQMLRSQWDTYLVLVGATTHIIYSHATWVFRSLITPNWVIHTLAVFVFVRYVCLNLVKSAVIFGLQCRKASFLLIMISLCRLCSCFVDGWNDKIVVPTDIGLGVKLGTVNTYHCLS